MSGVIAEIRQSSKILRDLATRSHSHSPRAPIVAYHLNIVLPCMSKTLRDITSYYEDKTVSRENRWKKMYHDMLKEAGGQPLPNRFLLYNNFLTLLLQLLTRDKSFEPALLEKLRHRILDLRQKRDISDPVQASSPAAVVVTASAPTAPTDQLIQRPAIGAVAVPVSLAPVPHWCTRVFNRPLASHTDTGLEERMEIYAPLVSGLDPYRPKGKVLMRRSFDNDRFCVKFIQTGDDEPFVVLRVYKNGGALVTWQAHSTLLASREGNAVALRRWSESSGIWKDWARFAFVHWEGEPASVVSRRWPHGILLIGFVNPTHTQRSSSSTQPLLF